MWQAILSLLSVLFGSPEALAARANPTCLISAAPTPINPGQSSTLTWSATNAKDVLLNGRPKPFSGTQSVTPTASIGYTLTVRGSNGRVIRCGTQVALTTDPILPPSVSALLRHSFWLGFDYDTTVSPQPYPPGLTPGPVAQWALDNVINVTPTNKRPAEISANANIYRQIPVSLRGGSKCFLGMGGGWGLYNTDAYAGDPAAELANHPEYGTLVAVIDTAIAQGCTERLYVDEPYQGYGCPPDQMYSDYCVARHARVFNLMFDYAKSRVSTIKTGICTLDYALYLKWLRAGMHADFACIEQYSQSLPINDVFGAIHSEFPSVEKYLLLSDTLPLCQAFNYAPTGDPPYPVTIAYWDINQYSIWYAGSGLDLDWLKNAQEFASTGERQLCKNPRGLFYDWNLNLSTGTTNLNTFNNEDLTTDTPPPTLTKCEWRVVSFPNGQGPNHFLPSVQATGVETLPWTEIPCAGNNPDLPGVTPLFGSLGTVVQISVGPSGLCRHNGTHACMVYYRVTNSLGRVGLRGFPNSVYGLP